MNIRRIQDQLAEMQRKYDALRLADKDKVIDMVQHVETRVADQDTAVAGHRNHLRELLRAEKAEWLRFQIETREAIAELQRALLPRRSLWRRICAWFK